MSEPATEMARDALRNALKCGHGDLPTLALLAAQRIAKQDARHKLLRHKLLDIIGVIERLGIQNGLAWRRINGTVVWDDGPDETHAPSLLDALGCMPPDPHGRDSVQIIRDMRDGTEP